MNCNKHSRKLRSRRPAPREIGVLLAGLLIFISPVVAQSPAKSPTVDAATAWDGQYKIYPWESERLTEADVVGPDGIVYPNVAEAGVQGGIPDLNDATIRSTYAVFDVTAYGAVADDAGFDDAGLAAALAAARTHVDAAGNNKAIVLFPAGSFKLKNANTIDRSRIVIDGAGGEVTRIQVHPGGSDGGSVFGFKGKGYSNYHQVKETALRGSKIITVDSTDGWAVGDRLRIQPFPTDEGDVMRERYDKPALNVVYHVPDAHLGRAYFGKITAIEGDRVFLDHPLFHDIYADEKPEAREASGFIEYSGIQDMSIEGMNSAISLNLVEFAQLANCWMKDVHLKKSRNWPIGAGETTHLEIRNVWMDGTWAAINKGGNAYLGFSGWAGSMLNLMDNVQGNDFRHHGIFQWSTASVIRNSHFYGSGGGLELHGRFPLENLVETSRLEFANDPIFVDPAHTLRHGPNGPRMVLYNNVFPTGTGAMKLVGTGTEHIYAYNQIRSTNAGSPAVHAIDRSFGGIYRGNVVQVQTNNPLATFEDISSGGWDLYDNLIYGSNGLVWEGDGVPNLIDNNRFLPSTDDLPATRPEVPSIYEWMRSHRDTPRVLLWINRGNITENASVTARVVRVKAPVDAALTVGLVSDHPAVRVPATVMIPAGETYTDFTIAASNVESDASATLTASASGLLQDTDTVTVLDSASTINLGRVPDRASAIGKGWRSMDMGTTGPGGSESLEASTGTLTVTGAGRKIDAGSGKGLSSTGRRFVYKAMDGDHQVVAQVGTVSGTGQAGLLVADDEAGFTEFFLVTTKGEVLTSGYNANNHGSTKRWADGSETDASWLKVSRAGSVFTAYRADVERPTDADWQQIASVDFYYDSKVGTNEWDYKSQSTLDSRMYIGVFVNSGSTNATATVEFRNIEFQPTAPSRVEAPVCAVESGVYVSALEIALSSPTPGATIRYTVDGSHPSRTSGSVYVKPFTVASTATLRAIAYKPGMIDSATTSSTYLINPNVGVPAAPSGVAAIARSSSEVVITWKDNSDNETAFVVERKFAPDGDYAPVGKVATRARSFVDRGVAPDTGYTYRIRAYNGAGHSDYTPEAGTRTPAANTAPAAPSRLNVARIASAHLDLVWCDNSTNEISFTIERKTGLYGKWGEVGRVPANTTAFRDTSLAADTLYYYRLSARNDAGESRCVSLFAAYTRPPGP